MADNQDGSLPPIDEEEDLAQLYKARGIGVRKKNLKEYALLKEQQKQHNNFRLPTAVKVVLLTPLIILFCIGLLFIPYMTYLFFTSNAK